MVKAFPVRAAKVATPAVTVSVKVCENAAEPVNSVMLLI